MIQITVIQLDNFGPYTETLGHDREHQVQIILSRAYTLLQDLFSQNGGLVFQATRDNMIAVTSGISRENHQGIMDKPGVLNLIALLLLDLASFLSRVGMNGMKARKLNRQLTIMSHIFICEF